MNQTKTLRINNKQHVDSKSKIFVLNKSLTTLLHALIQLAFCSWYSIVVVLEVKCCSPTYLR